MATNQQDETDQQEGGFGNGIWRTMRGQWGQQGGFGRAHFGQRGWLRPAILKLLEEKPMNGMEMINQFAQASHGWWRPSPGSIYPLLENLEKEGMIKKRNDGRYEITKKFREESGSEGQGDEMVTNLEGMVSYFEDMAAYDKAKLKMYKERIRKAASRLSKL